ncbi:MAG: hypothetical protein JW861_00065 [Bacteroidales bacterium]|nr:hypothetical protein [Bacteroidales bacterium]
MGVNRITTHRFLFRSVLIANLLLFGITGTVYLISGRNWTGALLLAACAVNIIAFTIKITRHIRLFAVVFFLCGAVCLFVSYDYYFRDSRVMHLIWLAISGIYLIAAIILLTLKGNPEKKP